jgi:inosine-uridine nucleoside N-ribohydrolase
MQVTENSLRTLESAGFTNVPVVQGAAVALDGTYYDPRKGERVAAPPGFSVRSLCFGLGQ